MSDSSTGTHQQADVSKDGSDLLVLETRCSAFLIVFSIL